MGQRDIQIRHHFQAAVRKLAAEKSMLGPSDEEPPPVQTMQGAQATLVLIVRSRPASILVPVEDITPEQDTVAEIGGDRAELLPLGAQTAEMGDYMLLTVEPGTTISGHGGVEIDIMLTGGGILLQIGVRRITVESIHLRVILPGDFPLMSVFDFALQ